VSCIYGIGNPEEFYANTVHIKRGQTIGRNALLRRLVNALYSRNEVEFSHGVFRVRGDSVDIFPAYDDTCVRIVFWGDQIEEINTFDHETGRKIESLDNYAVYPANIFVTTREKIDAAICDIQDDMVKQVAYLNDTGKKEEARRLEQRVSFDLEMIKELGYCSGIENYSRYFDGRKQGSRPFCLIDYFPADFLTVIDESHVSIPQIRGMIGGDRSRKQTLIEYGFRLPAALDNRPMLMEEFEELTGQTIFVSATPAEYELEKSAGVFVDQVIRPTGLLDPPIEVRPATNQIDDLMEEIRLRIKANERVLVTTITKRMAEELSDYLIRFGVKCSYIHSDIDTLKRIDIMEDLRAGNIDVLVGVNLLREGLDIPEVSLVAILDADKEGFLRSSRSLTQTSGRAARNLNGKVIMYADTVTKSMQQTIDETDRRRNKQLKYNEKMGITPTQIIKKTGTAFGSANKKPVVPKAYIENESPDIAADPVVKYMNKEALEKAIEKSKKNMEKAASELDFISAAHHRDEMQKIQNILKFK
jgi:excinuclease ABC subunit B